MKTVSVDSKHYDPLPPGKSSKLGKSWPPAKFFVNAQSLRAFILINFTLFHQFQDLKSLEYLQIRMENIYLLIENM